VRPSPRVCSRALCLWHGLPLARDNEDTSLLFNYYVKPPGSVEYALLAAPAPLTSVIISTLPVGISTVRAVAIDSRQVDSCMRNRAVCPALR